MSVCGRIRCVCSRIENGGGVCENAVARFRTHGVTVDVHAEAVLAHGTCLIVPSLASCSIVVATACRYATHATQPWRVVQWRNEVCRGARRVARHHPASAWRGIGLPGAAPEAAFTNAPARDIAGRRRRWPPPGRRSARPRRPSSAPDAWTTGSSSHPRRVR